MPGMDQPEPAGGAPAGALPLHDSARRMPAQLPTHSPAPSSVTVPLASVQAGSASMAAPTVTSGSDGFTFKVRYALGEYVVFMWQHTGYLIRRRRIGRFNTWSMMLKSTWSAAFHFVLQGRARHVYDFTIDQHGVVRTNGTGVTLVPWADVSAIRRYSRGYMMVLKRGTLPIPYRCLDVAQAAAMEVYAVRLREAARLQAR